MSRLIPFLWISLGAIVGANARYLVTRALARQLDGAVPLGTFVVNAFGCLAVGVIGTLVAGRLIARPETVRLVVMVGFLGSLTTFSAFAYETDLLMRNGAWVSALANVVVSVVAGMAGVRLGVLLTPALAGLR